MNRPAAIPAAVGNNAHRSPIIRSIVFEAIRRGAQALFGPLFGSDWQRGITLSLDDVGLDVEVLDGRDVGTLKIIRLVGSSRGSADGSLGCFEVTVPRPPSDDPDAPANDHFWMYLRYGAGSEEAARLLAHEIEKRSVFDTLVDGSEVRILSVKMTKIESRSDVSARDLFTAPALNWTLQLR